MRVYLKIKIKSLAAEATIIRQEQARIAKYPLGKTTAEWIGLRNHRIWDVRNESRSAGLAYGFLRGRSYAQMEPWTLNGPDFKRITQLIEKYGEDDPRQRMQRFAEWKDAATKHLIEATKPVFVPRPKVPYVPKVA